MSFGEKLASLRKEHNMSQEEMAHKLNVSRQAVSKWESNAAYPETDKIVAICKLFNFSMDELIGLKEKGSFKESKIKNTFNNIFDNFLKGIKMFSLMTFTQKLKCLMEIIFYALCLIFLYFGLRVILSYILNDIFSFIPMDIMASLINIFEGLFTFGYLVLAIYLIMKIYKIRYLDYYENIKDDDKTEIKVNNKENKKIDIKEEKIIMRDSSVNPFLWLKKLFILLVKFFIGLWSIPIIIGLVLLITVAIFILYYLKNGLVLLYVLLGVISIIIITYLVIEIIFRFIFNMKHNTKRYLITFTVGLILGGVSLGLFLGEVSQYKVTNVTRLEELDNEMTIPMQDNLAIEHLNNSVILFEDREDIKIEYYVFNKDIINTYPSSWSDFGYFDRERSFYVIGYGVEYEDLSVSSLIKATLDMIRNKEIYVYKESVRIVIHISKDNYNKIKENNNIIEKWS